MNRRFCARQRWICLTGLLVWGICALGCSSKKPLQPASPQDFRESAATPPHLLRNIRIDNMEIHLDLGRSGLKSITYNALKGTEPLRLVVDLPDTIAESILSPLVVENEIIGKIETSVFGHESPLLTRVEIGLKRDVSYVIDQRRGEIWVKLYSDLLPKEAAASQGERLLEPESEVYPVMREAARPESSGEESIIPDEPITDEAPPPRITAIQQEITDQGIRFYILANCSLAYPEVLYLSDPPRLVVDLMGVQAADVADALSLKGSLIKKVRVGLHSDKVRIVFDLIPETRLPYKIIPGDRVLVVSFEPGASFVE